MQVFTILFAIEQNFKHSIAPFKLCAELIIITNLPIFFILKSQDSQTHINILNEMVSKHLFQSSFIFFLIWLRFFNILFFVYFFIFTDGRAWGIGAKFDFRYVLEILFDWNHTYYSHGRIMRDRLLIKEHTTSLELWCVVWNKWTAWSSLMYVIKLISYINDSFTFTLLLLN